jgi:di/tricarboxylate transporter
LSKRTKIDATVAAMLGVAVLLGLEAISWTGVLEEKGAWDTMI